MTWEQELVVELAVPEASGLAVVAPDTFAVVDDERGVFLARADGSAELVVDRIVSKNLRDLEGACIGPDGSLWVLSERSGRVVSIPIDGLTLGAPSVVGELEKIGQTRNKGWEGLEYLSAELGGPWIVACHEGKPRRLGVFDPSDLATEAILKLPKDTKNALADLSDLTVDPATGHLLILSDESAAIAEVALEDGALRHIETTELDVGKREKCEGLAFDQDGLLWMCTDGDPHLRRFRR